MKKFWIASVLCILLLSCQKDPAIPQSQGSPKMALTCFLSPGRAIEASLVRVNPLFDGLPSQGPTFILDGKIFISDGLDTSELTVASGKNYYTEKLPGLPILLGKTYWIWASADQLPSVSARCIIPKGIVNNVNVNYYGASRGDDSSFHLSVNWPDRISEENYYRVYAENIDSLQSSAIDKDVFRFNTQFYSDFGSDGAIINSGTGVYTGMPKSVKKRWIIVSLITCDINYFRYHQNIESYSQGNPFVQPASLFSNIKGGVGCFGAFLQHTDKIPLF